MEEETSKSFQMLRRVLMLIDAQAEAGEWAEEDVKAYFDELANDVFSYGETWSDTILEN